MSAEQFYQAEQNNNQQCLLVIKKQLSIYSILRLTTFLASIGCFFLTKWISELIVVVALAVLIFAVFLYCVKKFITLKKQYHFHQVKQAILENEIKALNFDFSAFQNGELHTDYNHPYSYDLDLFGENSIFQMLNRTVFSGGEEKLAQRLKTAQTNYNDIVNEQNAVQELAEKPAFMFNFRTKGSVIPRLENEKQLIKNWIANASLFKRGRLINVLRILLPLMAIMTVVLSFFIPVFKGAAIALFLLNLFITSVLLKRINRYYGQMNQILASLKKYQDLLHVTEQEQWNGTVLKSLSGGLQWQNQPASVAIGALNKLIQQFENRLNILVAIFLEGFGLWDIQYITAIDKWKSKYGNHLVEWLEILEQFDVRISLATHAFNHADYVYPVCDSTKVIQAEALGHPLIPPGQRVNNNFELKQIGQFTIITGANMAGKSTFLRTVTTNLVLAQNGLPVCAKSFIFQPLPIITSMRTSDSLAKNESYFYAELVKLKRILDNLKQHERWFIVLDEILKGTNSHDKQLGSRKVLEKILQLKGTGIIATHDLELTNIENSYPEQISNQCFEIEIENSTIHFDYLLCNGVTQKMNAMLLMEQMGIV